MPSLFPYIFSAEPERKESLRHAFPISLHLVSALNVGKKIFWGNTSLFPHVPFSLQLELPVQHCIQLTIAKNENISKTAVTFLVFDSMFVNSYCTT